MGVKNLIVSLSGRFNPKTDGYATIEISKDNDSSAQRLISGDPSVTGHPVQDFKLLTIGVNHSYTPNSTVRLQYEKMLYDDDDVNNANHLRDRRFNTDDMNWGGWQRIRADLEIKY